MSRDRLCDDLVHSPKSGNDELVHWAGGGVMAGVIAGGGGKCDGGAISGNIAVNKLRSFFEI